MVGSDLAGAEISHDRCATSAPAFVVLRLRRSRGSFPRAALEMQLHRSRGYFTVPSSGYFARPMQYSASRVRRNSRPSATAGVARDTSSSTFLPSNSNSFPAFTT